jgi:type I restriction enzyme, S subunit
VGKYWGYEKYKGSGVEWLGEIPNHWQLKRLRFVLESQLVNGLFKKREFWGTGNLIVNVFDVYTENSIVNISSLDRVECNDDDLQRYSARHGDFFLVRSSLKLEGIGKSASLLNPEEEMVFECHLIRGRPDQKQIDPKLLILYLNCQLTRSLLVSRANQVTMTTIDQSKFKDIHIPLPPLDEQESIAHFLDRKTSQIDTLIAKKEALLEKLDEKRTALISHAVTKGLDRTVPMKDSGVEWLGEIPEHWEVSRIGFIANIGNGSTPNRSNESFWDQGSIPWLNSSKVNEKIIYSASQFVTEDAVNQCHLPIVQPDSIVLAITGEGKTRGNVAICKIRTTINQHLAYISPFTKRISLHFLFLYLQAMYEKIRTDSAGNGSTKGAITCQEIKGYKFPFPTIEEQEKIVYFLDHKTAEIDRQKAKVKEAIALLKEYRTALITNAVTDKIDVRQVSII